MLVSIGIPTYNRAATLSRALDSALAQTHGELEILVYDNASRDETAELCRRYAAEDARVRYERHPHNIGPTANFNCLFEACAGECVLILADDDWIEPTYVADCIAALAADSSLVLAAGRAQYVRDGHPSGQGLAHDHREPDPATRVRGYLATVDDNGIFYGVIRRQTLERVRPMPNVLGNDWLHIARVAFQGGIAVRDDVHIHRELGGTSADVGSILRTFGAAGWQQRVPQLVIAYWVWRDITWGHPVYAPLGRVGRARLGARGALASIRWTHLAWHAITPTVARLAARPRGRPVWAAYERLTRSLGAGQRP